MTSPTETMTIVLPLPAGILSPNRPPGSIGGRMKKAAAIKKQRKLARLRATEVGIESGPWELASLHVAFYHRQKRRRDSMNWMAMLKGAVDGIVDAGVLVDDDHEHLIPEAPRFEIDRDAPRVELTLTRMK